jgi:hypothetical protein
LPLEDTTRAETLLSRAARIPGLAESVRFAGVDDHAPAALQASAIEFVLEGLAATKKIGRSTERGYQASDQPARRPVRRDEPTLEDLPPVPGGKKKYYN